MTEERIGSYVALLEAVCLSCGREYEVADGVSSCDCGKMFVGEGVERCLRDSFSGAAKTMVMNKITLMQGGERVEETFARAERTLVDAKVDRFNKGEVLEWMKMTKMRGG